MDIKFSIVIPLYNKEKYIVTTIQSVLMQTYQDYEIIIVNDGSTDNSLAVVERIKDPRIRIFSKENGGVSSARNYGIEKASYEYIAFLDADDEWEPDYLEQMCSLIIKYMECGMYGSSYKTNSNETSSLIEETDGIVDNYFKKSIELWKSKKIKYTDSLTWTSATIIKKKVFNQVGSFPLGMIGGEDIYTWCKIAKKYKTAFTSKPLVIYNINTRTISHRIGKTDNCTESWIDLFEKDEFYLNEYIAHKAIQSGFRYILGFHRTKAKEIENLFSYTILFKKDWKKLSILNKMPLVFIYILKQYKIIKSYLSNIRS